MTFLLATLLACAPNVVAQYEEERVRALQIASERPVKWEPDLRLQIADADFESAVSAAVRAAIADVPVTRVDLPLGFVAEIRPTMSLVKLDAGVSGACDTCLRFDAVLDAKARWSVSGAGGTFPFTVGLEGTFMVEVKDGHELRARPRSVDGVKIRVADLGAFQVNPSTNLQNTLREAVQARLPVVAIADLAGTGLPIRDLRVKTGTSGILMEVLSNVPGSLPVTPAEALSSGVRVSISETALVGLARRSAFEQGELAMKVAADPRTLVVDGDRFSMNLRLWRLVGRGWWRDYTITGRLRIDDGKLVLTPDDVSEIAQSAGAGLVDPLAALFEGQVLAAIERAVGQSLPASRNEDLGVVRMRAAARSVQGRDGTLTVDGVLEVRPPSKAR